jgi:ADP-heptose:LPS heptosyltransferase
MTSKPDAPNLNLRRRMGPGLLALLAAAPLRLLLLPLRKRPSAGGAGKTAPEPVLMFSSYMVGDLFMALPALKRLAAATNLRVICRPDCTEILAREGLQPVPFDNAFLTRRTLAGFLRTAREAWRLRRLGAAIALDPDADPRSALWLRIAGTRVFSYRRDFGALFDETFPLPPRAVHQADRDLAVVQEFLRRHTGVNGNTGTHSSESTPEAPPHSLPLPSSFHSSPFTLHSSLWILSVWTRKPAKNWPLAHWEEFMERLQREGVPFAVLHAPDGDSAYRLFRARWSGRVRFVEGPLTVIADHVHHAAGVVATDNFLGHMGGYYGKPVLWINICSPAAQVQPRGPRTVHVQPAESTRPGELSVESVGAAFVKLRAPD